MLEITILASGSAGNAALVRAGETRILLDAGLSARRLEERLARCGTMLSRLDAIVLTHEHGDHTQAVRSLWSRCDVPIYANRMTAAALEAGPMAGCRLWRFFGAGQAFAIGGITLEAFSVPHDAADPVGFLVRSGDATFGLLTDLGHAPPGVIDRVREADALLIEANYDDDLLQRDTRRPWSVKQRISSRHGHLSNAAAAEVLATLCDGPLSRVFLGHLSRDCNTADLALTAAREPFKRTGRPEASVICAGQDEPTPTLRLGSPARREVVEEVGPVGQQQDHQPHAQGDFFAFLQAGQP